LQNPTHNSIHNLNCAVGEGNYYIGSGFYVLFFALPQDGKPYAEENSKKDDG
jgi:hypothetical protein